MEIENKALKRKVLLDRGKENDLGDVYFNRETKMFYREKDVNIVGAHIVPIAQDMEIILTCGNRFLDNICKNKLDNWDKMSANRFIVDYYIHEGTIGLLKTDNESYKYAELMFLNNDINHIDDEQFSKIIEEVNSYPFHVNLQQLYFFANNSNGNYTEALYRYIVYTLIYLDGKIRSHMLWIKPEYYYDKAKAELWYSYIKSILMTKPKDEYIIKILDEIYQNIIGDDVDEN